MMMPSTLPLPKQRPIGGKDGGLTRRQRYLMTRNGMIAAARAKGYTLKAVAAQFHLSKRQVIDICQKYS